MERIQVILKAIEEQSVVLQCDDDGEGNLTYDDFCYFYTEDETILGGKVDIEINCAVYFRSEAVLARPATREEPEEYEFIESLEISPIVVLIDDKWEVKLTKEEEDLIKKSIELNLEFE